MTVYKAIRPEANVAGELAIAAATGRRFSAQPTVIRRNRTGEVTSVLLAAVVVTRDNIRDTVLADGLYSKDQICTAAYARACAAAGIV
jgi:D-xylose transport system substrate-binding protein